MDGDDERLASFSVAGFLGKHVEGDIPTIRSANGDWFLLAEDLNLLLQTTASRAVRQVQATYASPEGTATRLLFRTCSALQGVVILAERGLATEALSLARGLWENTYLMVQLARNPKAALDALADDFHESRRLQALQIVGSGLAKSVPKEIEERVVSASKVAPKKTLPFKRFSREAQLEKTYVRYQAISNDALHVSDTSLHRTVLTTADRERWEYREGFVVPEDIGHALNVTIEAGIAVGFGYCEVISFPELSSGLAALADRLHAIDAPPSSIRDNAARL